MDNSIVIDTNVIIKSCNGELDNHIPCMKMIVCIDEGNLRLAVDEKGDILNEYKEHLINRILPDNNTDFEFLCL